MTSHFFLQQLMLLMVHSAKRRKVRKSFVECLLVENKTQMVTGQGFKLKMDALYARNRTFLNASRVN